MCKLYGGALVLEHQTNQSSLKIQENQNEIHEPNSTFKSLLLPYACNQLKILEYKQKLFLLTKIILIIN